MKKAKLLVIAMFMAISLGTPARAVFAAGEIQLTQADFTFGSASCNGTTANSKGIICYDLGGAQAYKIPAGNYILDGDIDLGTGTSFTNGASFSLDLNGKKMSNTSDMYPVLELDATTNTISGTGTIAGTGFAAGVSALGVYDGMSGALATRTTTTINGNPTIRNLSANGVTLTINGGTFIPVTENSGSINLGDDTITTINDATATGTDAMYAFGGKITINGGSFTSTGNFAFSAEAKLDSLTITGGTFTGANAGIALMGVPTTTSLSGGTYIVTGSSTDSTYGPITLVGEVDPTDLTALLASGYSYSDSASTRKGTAPFYFAYLTNKNVTISNGSKPTPEQSDDNTAKTESESTVGAPNSGVNTKESSSATASAIATLGASTAIVSGLYLSKKHFAKKSA